MTRKIDMKNQGAVSGRTGVTVNTTFGESLAFVMVTVVALISIVIGTWTTLAFVSAHAGEGVLSVAVGLC